MKTPKRLVASCEHPGEQRWTTGDKRDRISRVGGKTCSLLRPFLWSVTGRWMRKGGLSFRRFPGCCCLADCHVVYEEEERASGGNQVTQELWWTEKDIYCVNTWQEPACRLLLARVPDTLADGYAQVQARIVDNKHFMIKRRAGAGTGKMQIK